MDIFLLEREQRLNKGIIGLIGTGIAILVLLVASILSVDVVKVQGNEFGIKETMNGGVEDKVYGSKTYIIPGWNEMYRYSTTPSIFVMNSRSNDERANGRPNDSFVTKSLDNQNVTLDLALQWHFNREKGVEIHNSYHAHVGTDDWERIVEERTIRQTLMEAVNTSVNTRRAIDAYSGEGFVKMQADILAKLKDPNNELSQKGIVVETFVIEKIALDTSYIDEITKRQVAQQRELRAAAEEQAALAEARRAKAEAQTEYEQVVMKARQVKEQGVLASEGEAQQKINAAKAQAEQQVIEAKGQAEKIVLAANAEREAAEARAAAIRAIGEAEAAAKLANMNAYNSTGAENFVKIEVARSMADAFKGIQGYIPQEMTVNTFTNSWMDALNVFRRPTTGAAGPVK